MAIVQPLGPTTLIKSGLRGGDEPEKAMKDPEDQFWREPLLYFQTSIPLASSTLLHAATLHDLILEMLGFG